MTHNHDDSDNDNLADVFEQYRSDDLTDHNSEVFRRAGTGKTERIARHARHHRGDSDSGEFIDPKGDGVSPDTLRFSQGRNGDNHE